MRQTVKRLVLVLVAVPLLAGAFGVGGGVIAQESSSGGSGLRVSPTRTEVFLINGETKEITQTVKNVAQSPVTIQPSLNDFESDGTTGQPQLIGDPDEVSIHSLREFVTLPEDFDLQPDEEKELTIAVRVPEKASPGAYFGSVLYRASPLGSTNEGQVALVASVGSLILLEVPGDVTEKIQITDIGAYIGEAKGSFFMKKPDNLGVLIDNLGNGFAKPFGKIGVNDWGGNTIFEYELNDVDRRSNVLPESTRLFLREFYDIESKTVNGKEEVTKTSPITWPGRYTVTGNISHGTTGEVFTVSSTFWYIPAWLIIGLLVVILALVGAAFHLYRKHNSRGVRRKK